MMVSSITQMAFSRSANGVNVEASFSFHHRKLTEAACVVITCVIGKYTDEGNDCGTDDDVKMCRGICSYCNSGD